MEDDVPHISVWLGITVGLLASFVQSFGLTIQRLSHVANERLPPSERKRDWQRPLWLGGFTIFIISNVFGTLFQIGALPIVVLGPLGAVSLLWNAAFARIVLGDEFTVHLVVGTVLIAGGAVLIGIFGVVPEQTHTLEELVKLYRRPPFIIWVSLLAFFLVLILSIAHLSEWRLARHLASLYPVDAANGSVSPKQRRKSWSKTRRWSAPPRPITLDSPLKSSLRQSVPSDESTSSERSPLLPTLTPQRSKPLRLTFAENESEADSNNLFSPAPSIVGGGSRPRRKSGSGTMELDRAEEIRTERSRVWVGAAYGATSGTLSGLCLLFTKTGIELLIMSIMGKNQFGHFEAWLIVIVLLVCELFQLAYLNRALRLVGPTLVCPLAFCFYNTCSIISGLIYYNQWDELSTLKICLVTLGIAVLLGGVWIVSIKNGREEEGKGGDAKEERPLLAGDGSGDGESVMSGEYYTEEPDSEGETVGEEEEDEPLEWRPRGFSIGLAASSPGFELRPSTVHHRRTTPSSTSSPSGLPHHSTLDSLIRDAGDDEESASPRRNSNSLSRSMRGSLSGSLYVGPPPPSSPGHRRNRSGGTVSLPSTPLGGMRGFEGQEDEEATPFVSQKREGGNWWKFWNRSGSRKNVD